MEWAGSGCIALSDGSFRLVSRLGKTEKVVNDAHKGCLTAIKWSHDAQAICTAGEDGLIKIWSKTGNLRSSLVQHDKTVYCVQWSSDDESIAFGSDRNIIIRPIQSGQKQISWKAHDGVVLSLSWNPSCNLIVSGGEDCRYKVWDAFGRNLFSSSPLD